MWERASRAALVIGRELPGGGEPGGADTAVHPLSKAAQPETKIMYLNPNIQEQFWALCRLSITSGC